MVYWFITIIFIIAIASATTTKKPLFSKYCTQPEVVSGIAEPQRTVYSIGESVDIECLNSYELIGQSHLICNQNGNWEPLLPTCLALTCDGPVSIVHGSVNLVTYTNSVSPSESHPGGGWGSGGLKEGNVVEYSCHTGFRLHPAGQARLVCHQRKWVGNLPQCVSNGCAIPEELLNGYYIEISGFSSGLYTIGSKLQFVCHVGYILHGPDVFICDTSGDWMPQIKPQCLSSQQLIESQLCPVPAEVPHAMQKLLRGVMTPGGAVPGTLLEYWCREGYRNLLSPCMPHSLSCHDGEWRGTSPQCQEFSSCIAPPNIERGFVYEVASSYPLQVQVYYSCEQGYRLLGPSVLTCQDTGCWSPASPPSCHVIHQVADDNDHESVLYDVHSILVSAVVVVMAILVLVITLLLYQRAIGPKLMRLHNSGSGNELPQTSTLPPGFPPSNQRGSLDLGDPDRVALIAFHEDGVPPTYEEAVLHRPFVLFDTTTGGMGSVTAGGRYPTHGGPRSRTNLRGGVHNSRRTRHRDNPDNISYHSNGSARQSSSTSRSMSMRSWSACDSLGSSEMVGASSDSTNVTVDTLSTGGVSSGGASGGASQTPSCRALAGSVASFDTSSLANNSEGAPLIEEAEGEEPSDPNDLSDRYSLGTHDSDSFKDTFYNRSVTVSLKSEDG